MTLVNINRTEWRRTVGNTLYTFPPRTPVEVADDDLHGIAKDLGVTVAVPVEGTVKIDHAATKQLREMLLEDKPKKQPKKKPE